MVTYWHPNHPGQFHTTRVENLPYLLARYPGLQFGQIRMETK
jgi:hypothetical protein